MKQFQSNLTHEGVTGAANGWEQSRVGRSHRRSFLLPLTESGSVREVQAGRRLANALNWLARITAERQGCLPHVNPRNEADSCA